MSTSTNAAENAFRVRVVGLAETWLGTPYRHQGSRKGVGCDCLGLIRGVWRELHGEEPEVPAPYAMDWVLDRTGERLLDAARRHLIASPLAHPELGSVVLFRWRQRLPASHCGIVDGRGRLIHAYEGSAVVRSAMPEAWLRRVAGIFHFPECVR
ncbi:NlpC/P60 family protein [Fulvimarina sp. MAC8]|uniref:NlpC/P60 family protein n=1 Tax=Fulvimarina sp. MAC8 TaxID=3162874 RepID=UPI0032EC8FEA